MKALIIVDVQNDFVPGGALPVEAGDTIIGTINLLQPNFNLVVATQDWHPRQHSSFASAHAEKKPFETIMLNGLEQVLWPDHCVQGTRGAAMHDNLDLKPVEAIFRKGTVAEIDSYSGFYDNAHLKNTGLAGYLREREIEEVYVCGLAADYCVYFTAKDAHQEHFKTFYIEDATKAISAEGFEKCKADLRELGVSIVKSEEVRSGLV